MTYDPNNVFAKSFARRIAKQKVYEDDYALAIHNINPEAPIHVLVLVKGEYETLSDFVASATASHVEGYFRAVGRAADACGALREGCRFISNNGPNSLQEIKHLHMHILGGRVLGPLLTDASL